MSSFQIPPAPLQTPLGKSRILDPKTGKPFDSAAPSFEMDPIWQRWFARLEFKVSSSPNLRMVSFTKDAGASAITTGILGSIQIPFGGTIAGWSIEETSGNPGSISIDVYKTGGTQLEPVVPNTTTDKISASAPISLSSEDANGVGITGVSTWTKTIDIWDSILLNISAAATVQRVSGWILIQT